MSPEPENSSRRVRLRLAERADAEALLAIYAPLVRHTPISFELAPPDVEEMAHRVTTTLAVAPWLVAVDAAGALRGYAYATRFRARRAYDWIVETSVYVDAGAKRGGLGRGLYAALLEALALQGYRRAVGVITLPNDESTRFHEALGFTACGVVRAAGFKLGRWHDVGFFERPLGDARDAHTDEPVPAPPPPRPAAEFYADPSFAELLARAL